MTTILTTRRETPGNDPLADRISWGVLTTRIFREFCSRLGLSLLDGLSHPSHPDPFPFHKPMICRFCDYIAETEQIDNDDDAHLQTLPARGGDPQHAEPAEYEPICVECSERNPFVEMTLCDECRDYPCTCKELT